MTPVELPGGDGVDAVTAARESQESQIREESRQAVCLPTDRDSSQRTWRSGSPLTAVLLTRQWCRTMRGSQPDLAGVGARGKTIFAISGVYLAAAPHSPPQWLAISL